MADFLETCKNFYGCENKPVRLPFDDENGDQTYSGYSHAPFVELNLIVSGEKITVGNQSRPNGKNTAIINSMEYGASEGLGCTIEIIDEEGGNFTKSFDALNKGLGDLSSDITGFELDFGWIVEKKCHGVSNIQKFSVVTKNKYPINLLPIKMNVVYEGGKIKYTLEAQDMISRVGETRQECNIGRDDAKVPLKEAIRVFMKQHLPPPMLNVEFRKHGVEDADAWNFAKSDGGPAGPRNVWGSCQQNKLATLRRWISSFRTENNKGIILQWKGKEGDNPSREGGTVILLEDPTPDRCQQTFDLCANNIATYIVGGSNKSPVLSFNPSVNWSFTSSGGAGGSTSPGSGKATKQDGKTGCSGDNTKDSAGIQTGPTSGSSLDNCVAPDKQSAQNASSNTTHQEANAAREMLSPIEAELKIIGDPLYVYPIEFITKQISLLVINPFHLRAAGSNGCPEWLAEPICNPIFSNKGWHIMGVNHQIRQGSYVTTLKLMLPVPNVQLPPESPLGGDPNGYKVEIKTSPSGKCIK
jgi:hypothetical protein